MSAKSKLALLSFRNCFPQLLFVDNLDRCKILAHAWTLYLTNCTINKNSLEYVLVDRTKVILAVSFYRLTVVALTLESPFSERAFSFCCLLLVGSTGTSESRAAPRPRTMGDMNIVQIL